MHLLCYAYRFIKIVLVVFLAYHKRHIDKALSGFGMKDCAPGDTPIAKGDKFSLLQCPRNEIEKK